MKLAQNFPWLLQHTGAGLALPLPLSPIPLWPRLSAPLATAFPPGQATPPLPPSQHARAPSRLCWLRKQGLWNPADVGPITAVTLGRGFSWLCLSFFSMLKSGDSMVEVGILGAPTHKAPLCAGCRRRGLRISSWVKAQLVLARLLFSCK